MSVKGLWPILKLGGLFSCGWVLRVFDIFWIIVLYQISFASIFFQSVACLLILLMSSFAKQKFLICLICHLLIFPSWTYLYFNFQFWSFCALNVVMLKVSQTCVQETSLLAYTSLWYMNIWYFIILNLYAKFKKFIFSFIFSFSFI